LFGSFRTHGFLFLVHIEIVLHRLFGVPAAQQFVYFIRIKTGERYIERARVKLGHQFCQLVLVPFALYPVERKVERLFPLFVQFHSHAVDFRVSQIAHDLQPLMTADHVAGRFVPNHRLHKAELANGALELLIFRVAGL